MTSAYEKRLIRVLEYMHNNPTGDLSLDALADVAAMSRFHWHRVFHAMTGETCAQAVRRMRLHRAACWLVQTHWPIPEVAKRCGFENLQSFTRIFGQSYGMTPGAFRNRGDLTSPLLKPERGDYPMYSVEISNFSDRRLAALPHQGPYVEIGKTFETLSGILTSRGLWPKVKGMQGIYYDDPSAVAPEQLKSHAGVLIDEDETMPDIFEDVRLEGGRMAVLHFKGPYAGLKAAYDYVYGIWLPESGEEPRHSPPTEIYLNGPQDTVPEDLLTNICIPIK
ncbi:AraC family transcriptional regulator [Pseudaestuariivita rosea]|uniref:AraC family transcriptional regulator n=1 Tax=Pseudaestuariivita rosea TaxID=2763263 RepID=UPI001ABB75C7|nr:AraC family transcriptional regulator [Pseudaestuariivita rosea]